MSQHGPQEGGSCAERPEGFAPAQKVLSSHIAAILSTGLESLERIRIRTERMSRGILAMILDVTHAIKTSVRTRPSPKGSCV